MPAVRTRRGSTRRKAKLTRKSFFVDEAALRRARKALGVTTDAEVVRLSVDTVTEMADFWQFIQRSRRTLKPGSIRPS